MNTTLVKRAQSVQVDAAEAGFRTEFRLWGKGCSLSFYDWDSFEEALRLEFGFDCPEAVQEAVLGGLGEALSKMALAKKEGGEA